MPKCEERVAGEEVAAGARRGFLVNGLKGIVALFALGLGIPLAGFSLSPARKSEKLGDDWLGIVKVSDLKDSRPTKVAYEYNRKDGWVSVPTRKMVFVLQNKDGTYAALSNRCPHLGCGVDWDATTNQFRCPCHGGIFDLQGRVLEGPPPRPLDQFAVKVESGTIFIREA